MPIISISKIQHRRGLSSELPAALSEGELGFTLDTGEVVIGAPNFAPISTRSNFPFQNIQLLTEFSLKGMLEQSLSYTYRNQDPDHSNFPGPASYRSSPSLVSERYLQQKLDETVSVKAYGAKGNGIDDDTIAIRNALSDLYTPDWDATEQIDKKDYKVLYFPAGHYIVSSSLFLMPNCSLVGDGIGKTIIDLDPNFDEQVTILDASTMTEADLTALNPAILDMYNIGTPGDFDGYFPDPLPAGSQIFYTGLAGEEWKVVTSAYATVLETADSDGNVGEQINDFVSPTNGANSLPENIAVRGITIKRSTVGDIVRLNRASNVSFDNVRFESIWDCVDYQAHMNFGYFDRDSKYDQERDGICVRIDSLRSIALAITDTNPQNFSFDNCEFNGNTYGFYLTDTIENVNVVSSTFENMYKGVTLGEGVLFAEDLGGDFTLPATYDNTTRFGPTGFRVMFSTFKKIFNTAFSVFTSNPGNISAYNKYEQFGYGCHTAAVNGLPDALVPDPKLHLPEEVYWGPEQASFVLPNPPRANRIWSHEIGAGILFYADLDNELLTYDNMSTGDTFDYDGFVSDIRVTNLSNYNGILNTQDNFHIPYGVSTGGLTQLPMDRRSLELRNHLDAGYNPNMATGIILDTQDPHRSNSVVIDYSLSRGLTKRKGEIHIVTDGTEVNWWEQFTDIGNEIGVTFNVIATETGKFRVKYVDELDPLALNFNDPILLRWAARYWDHSEDKYGTYIAPFDGEMDEFGLAGTEDWGLITQDATNTLDPTYLPSDDYDTVTNPPLDPNVDDPSDESYGLLF